MKCELSYQPLLSPGEYRSWIVAAFHDLTWHHALAALSLSTEDYAKQVAQVIGKESLAHVLAGIMSHIRTFKDQVARSIEVDAAEKNLNLFCEAEKRIRAAAGYCLDNNLFLARIIHATPVHPTEALQVYERDGETQEIIASRTVYKFGD